MTNAEEMHCQEFVELVTDYLEGALSPFDRARVELHHRSCRDCATYLDQMQMTIGALRTLGAEPVPDRLMEDLLRAFRRRTRSPQIADVYALGSTAGAVPPGSHLVHYYATDQERDDFAEQYLAAGLRAGECCVILGDPVFVTHMADRLQARAEKDWAGRLFTAPWDRSPSTQAVREFADLHARLSEHGPVGLLPEVPLARAVAPSSRLRVRGLGNFRHWSATDRGSRYMLEICASVHDTYLASDSIVVCQYEVVNRPAALRWGGLAVHSHVVDGTCIADPSEVLERCVEDGAADVAAALASLRAALAEGKTSDALQTLQRAQADIAEMREFLASLHMSDPLTGRGRR